MHHAESGQFQGAHSELLWIEALLHQLSGLGPCWHLYSTSTRTVSRCPFWAATYRGVAPVVLTLVFVGTRLNQKSDNFKMPFLSCYEKRRCSISLVLVFVGTRLSQKSDNFKVPLLSCNVKRRLLLYLSGLGLCWAPDSTRNRTTSRCPLAAAM